MRPAAPAQRRWVAPGPAVSVALSCLLATLASCITLDGTLRADGSGTLEIVYRVLPTSTERIERRRFTSPDVTLESLKVNDDSTAVARLAFEDPAKLSTLEMLRSLKVVRQREGDEERLTITVTNTTKAIQDEGKPGPRIHLTLPGKVLEANRNATIEATRVTWRFGLAEFINQKTVDLTARYLVSSAARPAPAATPPAHGVGTGEPSAQR